MNVNSCNLKYCFLFVFLSIVKILSAQNYTLPDEFLNAKNGVKFVKIYSTNEKQPRTLVTLNQYDKNGRLIQANGDGTANVVRYFYNAQNKYSCIQIAYPNGKFCRKTIFTYDTKKGTTLMSHYANSKDSAQITSRVLEDSLHRTIRKTSYMEGREHDYVEYAYNDQGKIIGQKDSSAQTLTVNIIWENQLTIRKVYSTSNVLLHTYRFVYNDLYSIKAIIDSTSEKSDTYIMLRTETYGLVNSVLKNGNELSEQEREQFIDRFPMVDRGNLIADSEGIYDDHVKKEHIFEKDQNGNIVKDTVTISQGSFRQVLVFVYEYEYY